MKKMTQGDIDAGLTQEDVNLGLRGKVTKGDSDAAMRSRMTSEKYDSRSIIDQYRNLKKNPPAKAFPVADPIGARKGGTVKMAKGGSVSSASKRADGCAVKGKTRGMMR